MTINMNWYLKVIKQYADFKGRARRKEYWMFVLFNLIFIIVAMILDKVLGTNFKMPGEYSQELPYGFIYTLYALAIVIPGIAVSVRRLHDINKTGWLVLIAFIPFGGLVLLYWSFLEGTKGENQFGPDPKAEGDAVDTI